jgi:hypothetical protein
MQWVVNYADSSNYDLFQMDDKYFYPTPVRNGQKGTETRSSFKSGKKPPAPCKFESRAMRSCIWYVKARTGWTGQMGRDRHKPGSGKFGFYIPGGDQVGLPNFGHYLDLNLR